jgi:NAD(P)-dependent dehydrogenase (short-subunit alcohol dehydrogenase family)
VLAVDRLADHLATLETEAAAPGQLHTMAADLTAPGAPEAIIQAALDRMGRLEALVNNAGIGVGAIRPDNWRNPLRFWEVTPEQWQQFLAVNATAGIRLAQLAAPHLMRGGWGRVVSVTTSLGTMLRGGYLPYGATKATMEAATSIMAEDFAGTGVTANVLVPGAVTDTPLVPPESGFVRDQLLPPARMAPPLVWLMSEAANAVTGRRFLAVHWDAALPPAVAAEQAGAPIGWTAIAALPVIPT